MKLSPRSERTTHIFEPRNLFSWSVLMAWQRALVLEKSYLLEIELCLTCQAKFWKSAERQNWGGTLCWDVAAAPAMLLRWTYDHYGWLPITGGIPTSFILLAWHRFLLGDLSSKPGSCQANHFSGFQTEIRNRVHVFHQETMHTDHTFMLKKTARKNIAWAWRNLGRKTPRWCSQICMTDAFIKHFRSKSHHHESLCFGGYM